MAEFLRYYIFKPLWEILFMHFSMPLRLVLIMIFVCVLIWFIIRLKNVWKELFRFFLEILLLPEYLLSKNKSAISNWLKYGDFLNSTALFIIPLKENPDSKHINFYWLGYSVLFLLIIFFPVLSCREKIKTSAPSFQAIDKIYLAWTGFETWIISGDWREPSDFYFDFVSHKVNKNENLDSICSSYNDEENINSILDAVILMNKLDYPTIVGENIEQGWNLIIPVKKSLKINSGSSQVQVSQGIYRVKTKDYSGLKIRSEKNLDSSSVTYVPEGGEVTVIYFDNYLTVVNGRRGRWCWVRTKDGKEGWAWGWYLTNSY